IVCIVGLGGQALLRASLTQPPLWSPSSFVSRIWARFVSSLGNPAQARWPTLVVVAGALGYAAFFSYFTIIHHRNLLTSAFDLGLEDNLVWNALHLSRPPFKSSPFAGPNGSHFGHHATFFAYLLAPFYAIYPHPQALLVIQAVLLGAAAIPLYLFARQHI